MMSSEAAPHLATPASWMVRLNFPGCQTDQPEYVLGHVSLFRTLGVRAFLPPSTRRSCAGGRQSGSNPSYFAGAELSRAMECR
jgi:hypothetical protein